MRKHDVRKWLHAILDLLPVILIPVFMIYSHRHEINDGSIQVQEKIAVDFNQQYKRNYKQFEVTNDFTITFDNQYIYVDGTYEGSYNVSLGGTTSGMNQLLSNHTYMWRCYVPDGIYLQQNYFAQNGLQAGALLKSDISNVKFTNYVDSMSNLYVFNTISETTFDNVTLTPQIFDLTLMNLEDISISDFNQMFPNAYYPYIESKMMLVDGDLVTYNDTDIMSQFTYQLYNSVDKYFNVGNVFHLGEVYDWFNLNIFNGQAPLYIFVVYQIVLYELVMDLLFLLYALFMWFIDMIQKLMDKPLNSIK